MASNLNLSPVETERAIDVCKPCPKPVSKPPQNVVPPSKATAVKCRNDTPNQKQGVASASANVMQYKSTASLSTNVGAASSLYNNISYLKKFEHLKSLATKACTEKKVFTIVGNFPAVRFALLNRGWLEKLPSSRWPVLQKQPQTSLLRKANGSTSNTYATVVISQLLADALPNFVWQMKHEPIVGHCSGFCNSIKRREAYDFTSKKGLLNCADQRQWFTIAGISEIEIPRTHLLTTVDNIQAFRYDFHLTACLGLLVYVSENGFKVFAENGHIGINVFDNVLNYVGQCLDEFKPERVEFIRQLNDFDSTRRVLQQHVAAIVRHGKKFGCNDAKAIDTYLKRTNNLVTIARTVRAIFAGDGSRNIWIVKPMNRCRGFGIRVVDDEQEVLDIVKRQPQQGFIVQKYIERPLLIHKTKFDIRQHILLCYANSTLTLWMYKACYIRFSSQEFSLQNLSVQVHLTNYAIQKNFTNGVRSKLLPEHNMWSLEQTLEHFRSVSQEKLWHDKIYPHMKQNIIGVVLCSQNDTNFVENTFELYGCDFMITENHETVLIEINASPSLCASTIVTEKLCPKVLQDVIKVVVDLSRNPQSSTGDFERILDLPIPEVPRNLPNLDVHGIAIRPPGTLMKPMLDVRLFASSVNTPVHLSTLGECNQTPIRKSNSNAEKYTQHKSANKCDAPRSSSATATGIQVSIKQPNNAAAAVSSATLQPLVPDSKRNQLTDKLHRLIDNILAVTKRQKPLHNS